MSKAMRVRKYIHSFVDKRNGGARARYYFRRRGFRQVPLPGIPGSPEFEQAYAAAMAGSSPLPSTIGARRIRAGSLDAAALAWFNSPSFLGLSPLTRKSYRQIIESFTKKHGEKPIALLARKHIEDIYKAKLATHPTANRWLRVFKLLMRFAVAEGMIRDNPARDVEAIRRKPSDGIHTWTEEQISAYEAHHPIGSKARLALALALYTAARRSDLIKLGPQHVRNGVLHMQQQKTKTRLAIPIHPELQHILAASPSGHLTFLTTSSGAPFTHGGFGVWFKRRCREAGLPGCCSVHGLRKAMCCRLAQAGMSAPVIASISGHKTLAETQRYCLAADQERMARQGVAAMIRG